MDNQEIILNSNSLTDIVMSEYIKCAKEHELSELLYLHFTKIAEEFAVQFNSLSFNSVSYCGAMLGLIASISYTGAANYTENDLIKLVLVKSQEYVTKFQKSTL